MNTEKVGFEVDNYFLVGYGLDNAEDFRHLPYLAVYQQKAIGYKSTIGGIDKH